MALIDKASLLMVPSTYEAGKLYNVLPSGNRAPDSTDQNSGYDQTRADFDFDRGSNTAATRVNADGLIEKYRENHILYSNTFNDSSWGTTDLNVTSGATDPNGGSTAWSISNTAANGIIQKAVSLSGLRSVSIYAKQGTHRYLRIGAYGGTQSYANFDLQDGVVSSGTQAVIESIGGGWYRCTAWGANGTTGGVQIFPSNNATSAPTTNGSIFIWRVQLESGLVATDYLNSTSVTGKAGVLVDLPRINYDANGENGALLLEPSRKNLIPHSEWFGSGSGWSLLNNVSIGNFVLSPEGKMNATELIFDGSTGGRIERTISGLTSGADYSVSVYARVASGTQDVFFGSFQDEPAVTLTTEWQRLEKTQPENDTNAYPRIRCNDAATIEIYGFQLEAGSYATSYIPNHGESGGVTRAADSCSVTGASDVIGQTEGTIFVDLAGFDGNTHLVTLGDGTALNYLMLYISSGAIAWLSNGGLNGSAGSVTATSKAALAYKGNDSALYLDGVQVLTNTSSTIPSLPNVYLNNNATLTNVLKLETKQVTLFKERLSNAELAALTA